MGAAVSPALLMRWQKEATPRIKDFREGWIIGNQRHRPASTILQRIDISFRTSRAHLRQQLCRNCLKVSSPT